MHPKPIRPKPGQESVWDYPRPPRLELTTRHLRVVFAGIVLADTNRAYRVLETSHPPVYYIPPEDVQMAHLRRVDGISFCEWKGSAIYYDIAVGDQHVNKAAWAYPDPTRRFAAMQDYIAFYAHMMDACYINDEKVTPQPGNFYGGWITQDIVGPFKGIPGSWGW